MSSRALIVGILLCVVRVAAAEPPDAPASRRLTLDEAVALALEHNHVVRIAGFSVDEKEQARSIARGAYFPTIRTDASAIRLSDTQLIAIPPGGFGAVGSTLLPAEALVINQGGVNAAAFGVGVGQPVTEVLYI